MNRPSALPALVLLALSTFCGPALAQAVPVTAQRVDAILVDRELRAPATVVSANRAEIRAQVAALVDEVRRDVGARVAKGELLVSLDQDNARLALEQAEASLTAIDAQILEAQSRLAKAEELLEKNFISDEELISRRAALAVLEANRTAQLVAIEAARLDLSRTRITAPFDATVTARQAQVGSFAQPGTPLITIVQADRREVDVELDPRYASDVPAVSDLRFVSQGRSWPVRLLRLSDVVEISSRIVRARFEFVDATAPIGASGQLVWREAGSLVPVDLIVQRGSELGVFVAEQGSARFVGIPGAQAGRPAPVDLPGSALVVTRGHTRLQDGDTVQVNRQ